MVGWTWFGPWKFRVKDPHICSYSCFVSGVGFGRILLVSDCALFAKFREKVLHGLKVCFPAHITPSPHEVSWSKSIILISLLSYGNWAQSGCGAARM